MKRERQEKILELISTRQIGTQEELTEELERDFSLLDHR